MYLKKFPDVFLVSVRASLLIRNAPLCPYRHQFLAVAVFVFMDEFALLLKRQFPPFIPDVFILLFQKPIHLYKAAVAHVAFKHSWINSPGPDMHLARNVHGAFLFWGRLLAGYTGDGGSHGTGEHARSTLARRSDQC